MPSKPIDSCLLIVHIIHDTCVHTIRPMCTSYTVYCTYYAYIILRENTTCTCSPQSAAANDHGRVLIDCITQGRKKWRKGEKNGVLWRAIPRDRIGRVSRNIYNVPAAAAARSGFRVTDNITAARSSLKNGIIRNNSYGGKTQVFTLFFFLLKTEYIR